MKRFLVAVAVLALVSGLCACSDDRTGDAGSAEGDGGGEGARSESTSGERVTEAAASRGVSDAGERDDETVSPEINLVDLSYEWRLAPQKGLRFSLSFVNPHDTYERARGYALVIATWSASRGSVRGVHPWDVELDEAGMPEDYTRGTRLLFRHDRKVDGLIPYEHREGYYDALRVLVYADEGELLIDSEFALDVTGEATGVRRPETRLDL